MRRGTRVYYRDVGVHDTGTIVDVNYGEDAPFVVEWDKSRNKDEMVDSFSIEQLGLVEQPIPRGLGLYVLDGKTPRAVEDIAEAGKWGSIDWGERVMESWRKVWREGVAPLLTSDGLQVLVRALASDDPRLLQGATTSPPPLSCVQEWPVEAACVIGYCGWQGDGLETVGEVEKFFARICYEIDQVLKEPAGCRFFLNWADETPREEMRRELLPEVSRELARRQELIQGGI